MPIGQLRNRPIGNRKSTLGNDATHPLPRRGTDLISPYGLRLSAFDHAEANQTAPPHTLERLY
jgi:hypothetical protein